MKMTMERLLAFADAWGRHDVDAVMSFMTDDCIYSASVGPEPGKTYRGYTDVHTGVIDMMRHDDGSTSTISNVHIIGDRGFWEWTYRFRDGTAVRGCDFFEFAGDKICVKNAFRKTFA